MKKKDIELLGRLAEPILKFIESIEKAKRGTIKPLPPKTEKGKNKSKTK